MKSRRIVTLNLWGEQPPLDQRMDRIMRELANLKPDVVLLQEVRQVPGVVANQAAQLNEALGAELHFSVASTWGGGQEGLAILSRLPIQERMVAELPHASETERRILLGAQLITEEGTWSVYTTHLTYRLGDGQKRDDQVLGLCDALHRLPSDLPRVLGGDFNAVPDADEIRYLRGLRSNSDGKRVYWQDSWERVHGPLAPGFTWSRQNPHTERLRWLERDRRIDYVFVEAMRRSGAGEVLDCQLCFTTPDPNGVYASDHFGVVTDVLI